jgi:hypothetical protein
MYQLLNLSNLLASAVLLDGTLALAALFRIALDPVSSLTIIPAFLQPHLSHPAYNGPVITIDSTSKAELMRRGCSARHRWYHGRQR